MYSILAKRQTATNTEPKKGKMNYLEIVEYYMDEYGLDEETACRIADMETNPDYNADDYDGE